MKIEIENRLKQNVVTLYEEVPDSHGLAVICHGLGGFKEQKHIEVIAETFKESGYSIIRYDATNSMGDSGGNYEDATLTNFYNDLEDVITWARKQEWYRPPVLVGHSLGGMAVALYAELHPKEVKAVAPISPVVSGKLSLETYSKKELESWKRTGYQVRELGSKPGVVLKLKWSHMEDRLKYNLLEKADKLVIPVLIVVGEKDERTPPEHVKLLYDKISGRKEFHLIKNTPHTFRDEEHLEEIKRIFLDWIKSL
jgi:pimeloyl-ACP methyl ester carboxylesterase